MTVAITNKVPTTPVRGAGQPRRCSRWNDCSIASRASSKLDRAEVRRRNLIRPEQMPYSGRVFRDGMPLVYHSGDYPHLPGGGARARRLRDFRERQAQARREGRYIGLGIANYVEGTGLGPFEGVTIRVLPTARCGRNRRHRQGQGQRTMLSQVVADQLGCRIDQSS